MLTARARPQLHALAAELARATAAVSPRARRFHRRRGELAGKVRSLLSRSLPWLDKGAIDDLAEAFAPLRDVQDDLARLCRRVEGTEGEVERLAERAAEIRDPEVATWLRERTAAWAAALSRLGVDCERPFDVRAELEVAGLTEEEVRQNEEAVRWYLRAEAVLAQLGTDLAAAALATDLPQLKRRLIAHGARREWVGELQERVSPLEERAREVHDPPPALHALGGVITDLWGWSRLLSIEEAAVERLEERRNFFARDWRNRPAAEASALVQEAEALRARIVERALELRRRRLQELEDGMADLFQACGDQPELVARVVALKTKKFDRPPLFRDWLAAWEKEDGFFRAIATNHRGALEERLDELRARLGQGLAGLRARPLSDAVRTAADGLEQEVKGLGKRTGVEDVLKDLRRAGDLVRQLGGLARTAESEAADLAAHREANAVRTKALAAAAAEAGIELEGPGVAVAEEARAPSLEEARRQAAVESAEVARREAAFFDRCRQALAELAAELTATRSTLQEAGGEVESAALPDLPPDALPATAAIALRTVRARAAALAAQVDGRLEEALARRTALVASIAGLQPEPLGPSERTLAERLASELESGSWSQAETPRSRLARLAESTARASLFLAGLEKEKREAREELADLRSRLAAFEEEQLSSYCPPALVERVTALAYGSRPRPCRWRDVRHQVSLARTLLDRLDTHARRRAASEIENAVAALRSRRLPTPERTVVEALLADLDRRGHADLPPLSLRLKLRQATQGRP
jgi:hypothetical protein